MSSAFCVAALNSALLWIVILALTSGFGFSLHEGSFGRLLAPYTFSAAVGIGSALMTGYITFLLIKNLPVTH